MQDDPNKQSNTSSGPNPPEGTTTPDQTTKLFQKQSGVVSSDPALLNPSELPPSEVESGKQGDGGHKQSGLRDFLSFIGVLAIAGILAFTLIMFVFRSYSVDGPSMETTLQNQDKLIIWKLPRTIAKITGNQYVPNRGDVIVLAEDNFTACGQSGEREIIKRVVGLPGERVVVKNGDLVIYNEAYPNGFQPDNQLPYNKDGRIGFTSGDVDTLLAPNEIFVAGDNRPESCDSRYLGAATTDQVVGKLVIRLLPANKITLF